MSASTWVVLFCWFLGWVFVLFLEGGESREGMRLTVYNQYFVLWFQVLLNRNLMFCEVASELFSV